MEKNLFWLRNIWIVLVAILIVLVLQTYQAEAQTAVYTNRDGVIVKEVRQIKSAAEVPPSIKERADELRVLFELWTRTPMVPPQRVAMPKIVPTPAVASPPMAPLFIDGLYVGPSPSGSWTSITTKIPTVRIIK